MFEDEDAGLNNSLDGGKIINNNYGPTIREYEPGGSEIVRNQSTIWLDYYYNSLRTRMVVVPASVAEGKFLLDFEKSLLAVDASKAELTKERLQTALYMILRTYKELDVDTLMTQLSSFGLLPAAKEASENQRQTLTNTILDIRQRMTRMVAESGLTNLVLKGESLTDEITDVSPNIEAFGATTFSEIAGISEQINRIYQTFLLGEKGELMAEMAEREIVASSILQAVSRLRRLFRSGTATYTRVRASFVMDHVFGLAGLDPMVDEREIIPVLASSVSSVGFNPIGFADCVYIVQAAVQRMGGSIIDTEKDTETSIFDLASTLALGYGDIVPFIPKEVGTVDIKRIDEHFRSLYLTNVMNRLMSDSPGDFFGRITSAINLKSFYTVQASQAKFEDAIYSISLAFEAYRDTVAFYRNMYGREDVEFADGDQLSVFKRNKLRTFLSDVIYKGMTSFNFSLQHPAYYKQGAHIYEAVLPEMALAGISLEPKFDTVAMVAQPGFTDVHMTRTYRIFGKRLPDHMSLWDIEDLDSIPLPLTVLNNRKDVQPIYSLALKFGEDLMSHEMLRISRKYIPYSKMTKMLQKFNTPFVRNLIGSLNIEIFDTANQFARVTGMPTSLAETIWTSAARDESKGIDQAPDLPGKKTKKISDKKTGKDVSLGSNRYDDVEVVISQQLRQETLVTGALAFYVLPDSLLDVRILDISNVYVDKYRWQAANLTGTKYLPDMLTERPFLLITEEELNPLMSSKIKMKVPGLGDSKNPDSPTGPDSKTKGNRRNKKNQEDDPTDDGQEGSEE